MRALLLALALTAAGCATLPPPIVQRWTVVLVHDRTVVHEDTVTELFPVLTWRQCARGGFVQVAARPCRERRFRFVTLDRSRRVAIYRELR